MSVGFISDKESPPMTKCSEIGRVEAIEETQIEWKIADFFLLTQDGKYISYQSPTFFIAGVAWFLKLCPKCEINSEFMRLYLMSKMQRGYSIEYHFGYKDHDGTVGLQIRGILKGDNMCSDPGLIRVSELLQQTFEGMNAIDFTCTLKREITQPSQPDVLDRVKPFSFINLDKLSENFKDLFEKKETCDTTMNVSGTEFKVHKAVLIARSPVFAAMFQHDTTERRTGIINIPDCEPNSFQELLEYLYCGKLKEMSFRNAFHLYDISNKYDFEELMTFCAEYLMQCLAVENICDVVVLADKYDEMKLFSAAQHFFTHNVKKILETPQWESLLRNDFRLANKLMIEMSKIRLKD